MQVFLFLKPLEQELIVAGEDVPVEVAEVVAGGVFAMVGKLDPAAELHRPPLGQKLPAKDPPRDERQVFELLQEVGIEECHRWAILDHPSGSCRLHVYAAAAPNGSTAVRISSMISSGWNVLGLAFEVEDQPVPQRGVGTGAQVFARDVVAVVEDGADLGGQDDGLAPRGLEP